MIESVAEMRRRKKELRQQAEALRAAQPDKDDVSRAICRRFADLPEYAAAPTVLLYVHVRNEVRTIDFLLKAIQQGKRVVVPYVAGGDLELFRLETLDELAVGNYGILEPRLELRALPNKRVHIAQVDFVMTPGVAFDSRGGRLGHGKGYYDRLLIRARSDAALVGAAYDCQVVPEAPMTDGDVFLDKIVTEREVYLGRGRQGGCP